MSGTYGISLSIYILPVVVFVDLAQPAYTVVEEEEGLIFCTNLTGLIARSVPVSISTQNDSTAKGKLAFV